MLTSIFQPNLQMLQNLMHSSQGNLNQVLTQLQINSLCQGQMFQQYSAMETDNAEQQGKRESHDQIVFKLDSVQFFD